MKLRHLKFKALKEHKDQRIDQALTVWLNEALKVVISKQKARQLLTQGAIYLNKKRVKIASKKLIPGATIEAYVNLKKLLSGDTEQEEIKAELESQINIVLEDEHIIIVDKPAGLPTQPTVDEARLNLFDSVKKMIKDRNNLKDAYLGLHHRLDRGTSGLVLMTKTKQANPGVAKLFTDHLIEKTYVAKTHLPQTEIEDEFTISNFLKKSMNKKGKKMLHHSVRSGGQKAITDFKILERNKDHLIIQAKPKTGRTHQIRVHLSEYGIPIIGDELYGNNTELDQQASRMFLHAQSLQFEHPMKKTTITVEAPVNFV